MRRRARIVDVARVWAVAALVAGFAAGCGGDDDGDSGGALVLTAVTDVAASLPTGAVVPVTFAVSDASGAPRAGVAVQFAAEGGGRVNAPSVVSDESGNAVANWTLGVPPVVNRLLASAGEAMAAVDTLATLAAPLEPAEFGDIPGFMAAEGLSGSTEDLAFDGDQRLILGIGGGLIAMDANGTASLVPLSGDPIVAPLGVAYDAEGNLWVADSRDGPAMPEAGALLRVSSDGVVTTQLTSVDGEALVGPNYIAIGPDGKVYLSDPCIGAVFRLDPVSGAVDAEVRFAVATQGGPNGMAFDVTGEGIYVATESIALLCGRPDVDPTLVDPVAGLFFVPVDEAGFGAIAPVAERMGLFGDGVALDALGNVYAIFDTQANLALEESAVWVFPAGLSEPVEPVKFLASTDRVFANIAFGRGAFGDQTMYIALLAIDAFNLPIRGVDRIDVGIAGLPLPR